MLITHTRSPLHPANASIPMICTNQNQQQSGGKKRKKKTYDYTTDPKDDRPASPRGMRKDILWHVLYDTDIHLVRALTLPAAQRAEASSSGKSEIIEYTNLSQGITASRALFFLVLNVDEKLRADVCSAQFCDTVWTAHGIPVPFDPYKATRFFLDIQEACIHPWMRNERCSAADLVESIRELYMCS